MAEDEGGIFTCELPHRPQFICMGFTDQSRFQHIVIEISKNTQQNDLECMVRIHHDFQTDDVLFNTDVQCTVSSS